MVVPHLRVAGEASAVMRHMELPLTKAPPEEDTAVLEALDFEPEFPCEFYPDGVNQCEHRADLFMVTTCECGTECLPICACCAWIVTKRILTGRADFQCWNAKHIVTDTIRFIAIK